MNYYNFFGINKEQINRILSIALSKGGDYADIYFEHSLSNELSLKDSQVNAAGTHIDFGVGIRVIKGERTGYAYAETTNLDQMINAAKTASEIANSRTKAPFSNLDFKKLRSKNYYPIQLGWEETDIVYKIPYLQDLNSKIFAKDRNIIKASARISDSISKILFFNSLGESFSDLRPMLSITATCAMEVDGKIENGSSSRSYRCGFELLTDNLIEEIANECYNNTSILFKAIKPKGGQMPVVMGAGSSGILLHEAIGHAFEADFNRKGSSIFSNKMGKKICNENINIVDDATIMANRGSCNFDDEGVKGQKTYMVKNGILNSYLHDRISASYYGVKPTGNGRRESFRYMPIPRMRATYMENGQASKNEIIKSVKKGIYVDTFSNGQVQIGEGDFTFFVKSGYLIENGELSTPIKDINIIGNGPKALADITMVANDSKIEDLTWTCGKEQMCPVSCGMPSVLVKKLNVGGTN